jgi:Rho-binding antiterminator
MTDADRYTPISCDFHDLLEVAATTRKVVRVRFVDETGAVQDRCATIVDVAEYLRVSTGETLRLDRLVAVDDAKLGED